jgi:hypothetical protein
VTVFWGSYWLTSFVQLPSSNVVTLWSVVIVTAVINSLCLSPVSHDYSCLRCLPHVFSKQSEAEQHATQTDWQGRGGHQCRRSPNSVLYISNFSAVLSTFRDWFRRIRMKPRDWQVGLPHSHPVAQLTHSPTKRCPSSSEIAFVVHGLRLTLLQSGTVLYDSGKRHFYKSITV